MAKTMDQIQQEVVCNMDMLIPGKSDKIHLKNLKKILSQLQEQVFLILGLCDLL